MSYISQAKFSKETAEAIDKMISDFANSVNGGRQTDSSNEVVNTVMKEIEMESKLKRKQEIEELYPDDAEKQLETILKENIFTSDDVYLDKKNNRVSFRDPNKYKLDEYDLQEIMKLADTRLERLAAPTFFKSSVAANRRALEGGSSKSQIGQNSMTQSELIQSSIYNTLFRSFDREWNISIPTMATNGKIIYMNPYFTLALTLESVKFVIAHEIMHIVLSHTARFNDKYIVKEEDFQNEVKTNPIRAIENHTLCEIFNIALDLIINAQLVKDRWGEKPRLAQGPDGQESEVIGCFIDDFENYTEDESIVALGNSLCSAFYNIYIEMCKSSAITPSLKAPLPDGQNVKETSEHIREMVRLIYNNVSEKVVVISGLSHGVGNGGSSSGGNAAGMPGVGGRNSGDVQNTESKSMTQKELDDLKAKITKALIDSVLKKETGASKTIDSHEKSMEKIREYAKEKGYPNEAEAIKNDVNLNVKTLIDGIMEDLAAKGITPEELMRSGYGCVGSNIAKAWHVNRDQPHRDYKIEIMEFFKKIGGERFNTWEKWNKKNNALRSAARSIARNGGAMRTLLIPSTYDTSGRVIIAIDTSGSIYYDAASMKFAASEIMRLTGELERRKGSVIDIVCCDTDITDRKTIKTGTDEFRDYIEDIEKNGVKMTGSGGTDLLPIWDLAMNKDNKYDSPGMLKPAGMIVVTDTMTANANTIAKLYEDGICKIPTMILVPDEQCITSEWKALENKCGIFGIGIISELLKAEKEKGYELDEQER